MHIVLVEPEIPGNTGNIARLCAGTGMELHLVRPLGFSTDDRHLKRAGLDYWHLVKVHYHDSFADVQRQYEGHPFYFCTTKSAHIYSDIRYTSDALLVFGKETAGLPESLLAANEEHTIRIPMHAGARSLNLSNAVAVVAYEALRQNSFAELCLAGTGCNGGDH
ncbi:tRNA (cytidine(34)-2'-O)-methyltransferase [Selenomonas timonae]|mgnify:FL=1|jgi:trmH family RNA methyltransferase|uniref:Putative tRNA (cytidine(34)-2'-O)-methyltransferase n=1 Tax=Selenomonas timonae TaxID=2754044 RepID=A0A7G7VIU6_9FIRM|nr:tRNA (cytidine(34)-2'-O)-methyltransferase [Selenomonas timonae]QNH54039.1 tRNA (cytidine(34)-2'-O)-methyltransferase [Selenomonas timonae]